MNYRNRTLLTFIALLTLAALACGGLTRAVDGVIPGVVATAESVTLPPTSTPTPLPPTATLAPDQPTPIPTLDPVLVTPTPDPPSADKTDLQLQVFEQLWTTVEQVYVYPDFNGLDWNAVREEYRATIEAGIGNNEFYPLMQALLDELGDEHSQFLSPEAVAEELAEREGNTDYVGIGVLVSAVPERNRIVILTVFPNSPAERAGLRAHDSILEVDGQASLDAEGFMRIDLVRGPENTDVTLLIETPGQEPRLVTVTRQRITGGLPVNAELLPNAEGQRVLYMIIPTFSDRTILDQVEGVLVQYTADGPLDAVIVDNRINGGGYSDVLQGMLSLFTEGLQGTFYNRVGQSRELIVEPYDAYGTQAVPLVVLVGRDTVSYGEVFSGVLQDSGRAIMIGGITDGNVETLYPYDFVDGSRAYIAQETFLPAVTGADWERDGLVPDIIVEGDWDQFSVETDPALSAALEALGLTPITP